MSFTWIPLYSEIARKLLSFQDRQSELLGLLGQLSADGLKVISLKDQDLSGKEVPLAAIDPFTFFASFNRIPSANGRQEILAKIKEAWQLTAPVPEDFDGIPITAATNSWSFSYLANRKPDDIPTLWRAAKEGVEKNWRTFDRTLFDEALSVRQMGLARLTMSLFWLNPSGFLSFDRNTIAYFKKHEIVCESKTAAGYFAWLEKAVAKVGANFPQISHDAYEADKPPPQSKPPVNPKPAQPVQPQKPALYTKADALSELFMTEAQLDVILARLKRKQAIILQGPPGVEKTFIARRLAFALMDERDEQRVKMVQFHPSYGYEDFVQGYRPVQAGLQRRDGVFNEFARLARNDPGRPWFFIIDEINRGNLAKIFGELLMLLEVDNRGPDHAIPLTYSEKDETFDLPANVHVIGTMNTADRSLAMVDYALRRRFAFVTLHPSFDSPAFAAWLTGRGATEELLIRIRTRVGAVNAEIEKERDLGPGFRIGHSFFCPGAGHAPDDAWYREVVVSEIQPLLEEYFESTARVEKLVNELLV